MINETFRLKEVLEENGIQTKLWHDDYKVLPGGNNYRIWLSNEGNVAKIELMDKELALSTETINRLFQLLTSLPSIVLPMTRVKLTVKTCLKKKKK